LIELITTATNASDKYIIQHATFETKLGPYAFQKETCKNTWG